MRVITDWVRVLARAASKFIGAWNELPRDRIVWIFRINQRGNIRRDSHRVPRSHFFQIGECGRRHEAVSRELGSGAQSDRWLAIDLLHGSPAGGVQTT